MEDRLLCSDSHLIACLALGVGLANPIIIKAVQFALRYYTRPFRYFNWLKHAVLGNPKIEVVFIGDLNSFVATSLTESIQVDFTLSYGKPFPTSLCRIAHFNPASKPCFLITEFTSYLSQRLLSTIELEQCLKRELATFLMI